jgi:NADH-quinone oxidoreductase subunit L
MIASSVIALAGLGMALALYGSNPEEGERKLHAWLGRLLPVLQQKYYLDHFWASCLTHLVYLDSKLIGRFDEKGVDGAVYGVGKATFRLGNLVRKEQTGQLQRYALTLVVGLLLLVFALALLEPEFVIRHLVPPAGPALPGGGP